METKQNIKIEGGSSEKNEYLSTAKIEEEPLSVTKVKEEKSEVAFKGKTGTKSITGVKTKQQGTLYEKKIDCGGVCEPKEKLPSSKSKNDTKCSDSEKIKKKSSKKEVLSKECSKKKEEEETAQKIDNNLDEESKETAANISKKTGGKVKSKSSKKKLSKKTNRVLQDVEKNDQKQSTITQHFQVRRSERKPKRTVEKEARQAYEERILSGDESNLEVRLIEGKGRGVFSKIPLRRGDLVCEYAGELISRDEALEREQQYSETPEVGCYMYYFEYAGKRYCVDATKESGKLGRLLNHSKTNANVYTRLFPIKNKPYLILVAACDVKVNEELLYDYGERNKTAIESHPWLKS